MAAVAAAAGVAKPTLYRRYANRDELLAAIARAEAEHMSERFCTAPASRDDVRQALEDFAERLTTFMLSDEHIRFIHALAQARGLSASAREAIYRNGPRQTRERLSRFFARAHREGLIHSPDPERSAERFLGMLMGLDLVRTLYQIRDAADPAARAREVVHDFLYLCDRKAQAASDD